jgi:NADH-quinone oxidoreductase subunit N
MIDSMNANTLALLPEGILTVAGVAVMVLEPVLPLKASRKPLGWLAILATVAAGVASWYQLRFGTTVAFSGTIQVDAFSVFFHLLIAVGRPRTTRAMRASILRWCCLAPLA